MAYELNWLVPKRIVLTRIYDAVSPDEMTEILTQSRQMTLSNQEPVHFIIDISALKKQPFSISKLNEWVSLLPSRTGGWWVVINPNAIAMFAITLVTKTLQVKLKSAKSFEEAVQILKKIDHTLIEYSLNEVQPKS